MNYRFALLPLVCAIGCLGPQADDTPRYSAYLRPSDYDFPTASSSENLRAKIDRGDPEREDFVIPLRAGYASNWPVHYWDLGPADSLPNPIWFLRVCDGEGEPLPGETGRVDHPPLVDTVPGDTNYGSFWWVWTICVTPAYGGERIASLEAMSDALDLGLILEPTPTKLWLDAPITLESTELETSAGTQPVDSAYYRGSRVGMVSITGLEHASELPRSRLIPVGVAFILEKEDDDDFRETIFEINPALDSADYTPLVEIVYVEVEPWYAPGTVRNANSLVRLEDGEYRPIHSDIVSVDASGELRNLEVQWR